MTSWGDQRVAFAGTGQMATALAAGFVRTLLKPDQISGFDPFEPARRQFAAACPGASVSAAPSAALAGATLVILAVKPQMMEGVLEEIRDVLPASALVVSIAAGIPIRTLAARLHPGTRLMRVMPNTPALIGRGAAGLSAGQAATAADQQLVTELMSTVGLVESVPESLMDAVTGLSGSGPAYVLQFLEALSDGGVKMGLSRAVATRLAAQTLAGTAEMLLQTGQHPAALRDAVTSPGGTTIAGLHALENSGVRGAVISAVEAATCRSRELSER